MEILKKNKIYFIWLGAFVIATLVLANSHFKSQSNDSKYYTDQVVRYHAKTWSDIMTAKWGENYWGFDPNSYNLDSFPGQLILGIAVTKLGAPPEQALHILGMGFQILSIFLLVNIAKEFLGKEDANVLFYSVLLTPMAFSYNIRANHELGIMFFSFLALYSGLKLPLSKWWGITSLISTVMLLWIKGPFFIFALTLTAIGFLFSRSGKKNILVLGLVLFLSVVATAISAWLFDTFFFKVTGQSFLVGFWNIQIAGRHVPATSQFSFITQKIHNIYYYSWHSLVYALPWALLLLISSFKNSLVAFVKSPLSLIFLFAGFSFILVFTVNSRYAARYVFPSYYLFSAWSILALLHISDTFKKIHLKVSRIGIDSIAPILWLVIFSLHFLF